MVGNGTSGNTTHGWVPQGDGRGTLDIVWTSGLTIFLCIWTSVCVNVPSINSTRWDRFQDKLGMALVGLLGPDYILLIAVGQWYSARRSVKVSPCKSRFSRFLADHTTAEGIPCVQVHNMDDEESFFCGYGRLLASIARRPSAPIKRTTTFVSGKEWLHPISRVR